MSEVFQEFRTMMGMAQRATLAYRPQANGQQERSVQTVIRAVKTYVQEADQSDWEDLAERLMFALNTSWDATRKESPFFLVHGWDPKLTVSAMLQRVQPRRWDRREAYLWRLSVQRDYETGIAKARELQKQAKNARAEARNLSWQNLAERDKLGFEVGDAVWLYIARVRPGLVRKLAHHWHGPFRIKDKSDDLRIQLDISGTPYHFYPWVHVGRLKPRILFPERPTEAIEVSEDDDLDAALLPEDSWEPEASENEYEVEKLLDVRWKPSRTRTSRRQKEYLVKWVGYDDPTWEPVQNLNCGRLLHDFNQSAKGRSRFESMQVSEDVRGEE